VSSRAPIGGAGLDLSDLEDVDPETRMLALSELAGRALDLPRAEVNGAVRRAQLLLATGGDPLRPLELDGRAVVALAADLETPQRAQAFVQALDALRPTTGGRPALTASLETLCDDPPLAWRIFSFSVLARALTDDEAL
jgi:hypothetical protein